MVDAVSRVAALRAALSERNLDGFILPRFDAHQAEYVAPHDERLKFITGFSGSAGMAIVTSRTAAIFVDGRYTVQAAEECPEPVFSHHHLINEPPETWLARNADPGWRIGYDPMHIPPIWFDRFAKTASGFALVPLNENPVDEVWADQPTEPMGQITPFPLQFAGQSSADKINQLAQRLNDQAIDIHVETQPDNIAWLLNIRGSDTPFSPFANSFALADKSGDVDWFVADEKLDQTLIDHLPSNVRIAPMESFLSVLRARLPPDQRIAIDPGFSPVTVRTEIENSPAQVHPQISEITQAKACKNATEMEGMRACHIPDGVAMTEFSAWLLKAVPERAEEGDPVTEQEAEKKAQAFRARHGDYIAKSFNWISAVGGNAAMCHYATTEERDAEILPVHPYLLDSGGQYETGTTDITRSFAFGQVSDAYRRAYTAVFKGFHALASLRFPKGTQGHHIDSIARYPLWELGLDYDHGTGHGIGHRLSVHEHPQRIGKPYNPVDLAPGMVMSIEPGHYVAGEYGIRIENLFQIVEAEDGFLEFNNITYVPIQTDMLNIDDLTPVERSWLKAYHTDIRAKIGSLLSSKALAWIDANARPLS